MVASLSTLVSPVPTLTMALLFIYAVVFLDSWLDVTQRPRNFPGRHACSGGWASYLVSPPQRCSLLIHELLLPLQALLLNHLGSQLQLTALLPAGPKHRPRVFSQPAATAESLQRDSGLNFRDSQVGWSQTCAILLPQTPNWWTSGACHHTRLSDAFFYFIKPLLFFLYFFILCFSSLQSIHLKHLDQ